MNRHVPIIDLAAHSGRSQRNTLATKLGEALSDVGFAVLEGHGIPQQWMDDSFEVSRQFFALPLEVKLRLETPTRMTGYTPFKTEVARGAKEGDLKEIFDVRRPFPRNDPRSGTSGYETNVWPGRLVPQFRYATMRMWHAQDVLARVVLAPLNRYLGYPDKTLEKFVHDGNSLGRKLHYPPYDGTVPGVRSTAHEDSSVISLLRAATDPGLEVQRNDGSWIAVDETPNSEVLNVGKTLQAYTRGRLRSTVHRVVNPDLSNRRPRYADPFFVQANPAAAMNPPGFDGDTTFPNAGQFLIDDLSGTNMWRPAR